MLVNRAKVPAVPRVRLAPRAEPKKGPLQGVATTVASTPVKNEPL
jgi:hypothetical protein